MKRVKQVAALLVALVMVFASGVPVRAHDAEGLGAGPTTLEIMRAFHWVVRGDTLGSIAAQYGTTPELIIYNNWDYFHDLRLRNITYGLMPRIPALGASQVITRSWTTGVPTLSAQFGTITLEPGVRLHIYDVLQVRYYVRRGDTIAGILDGSRITEALIRESALDPRLRFDPLAGFRVQTTLANLRAENAGWFLDVDRVNTTLNLNHVLLESQEVGAVHTVWHTCPITGIGTPYLLEGPFGVPLYITIPVRAFQCMGCPPPRRVVCEGGCGCEPTFVPVPCPYVLRPARPNLPGQARIGAGFPEFQRPGALPNQPLYFDGDSVGPNTVAYSHVSYLRGVLNTSTVLYENIEALPWVAWDATLQFNSFNPPPTNDVLLGMAPGVHQVFGLGGADPHFIVRNLPGDIRGGIDIPGPVGAGLGATRATR